jgi:hypothetical protein
VIAGAVIGGVLWMQQDAPDNAKRGDCIKVNDVQNADVETIECNSAEALYEVATTSDKSGASCPEGNYVGFTKSEGGSNLLLCLMLNAKEGDCYKRDGQIDVKADCAKDAEFQVVKVIEDSIDVKKCGGKGLDPYLYSDPKLTQCRAAPKAVAG